MDMCVEHGVKNLLYASSSSVYGDRNDGSPFKESDPADSQMSPYAVSKRTNELMARNYHNIYGLNTMGLRFFTVYGPNNRRDMAMWKFTDAIYHGKEIELYNNGRCLRDFTYIDDITNGMLSIINQTEKWDNGAVNIGCGNIIMVGELPYIISEFLGKEAIIKYIGAQQGDVGVTHACVDKISQVFGYTPRWNLRDGVKNYVEWYLSTQR